jgi:hypothetical protein
MPLWTFDRADRLALLAERMRLTAAHLRSEAFGHPKGSQVRDVLSARLAIVQRREQRLRERAKWARRRTRELANLV